MSLLGTASYLLVLGLESDLCGSVRWLFTCTTSSCLLCRFGFDLDVLWFVPDAEFDCCLLSIFISPDILRTCLTDAGVFPVALSPDKNEPGRLVMLMLCHFTSLLLFFPCSMRRKTLKTFYHSIKFRNGIATCGYLYIHIRDWKATSICSFLQARSYCKNACNCLNICCPFKLQDQGQLLSSWNSVLGIERTICLWTEPRSNETTRSIRCSQTQIGWCCVCYIVVSW